MRGTHATFAPTADMMGLAKRANAASRLPSLAVGAAARELDAEDGLAGL